MQQAEPVADFVHGCFALTIAVYVAARHAARYDVTAVLLVVGLGVAGLDPGRGQGAVAEQHGGAAVSRGAEVGLVVDVQVAVVASAESCFHADVVVVCCPAVVDAVGYV